MRFRLGPVPEYERFDPVAEGWTPLREPAAGALLLAAVPVGIAMAALVVWIWSLIAPVSGLGRAGDGFSMTITLPGLLRGILLLAGFVLLHELLHAVPVMLAGSWDDLVIGFWPRHLAPYFATLGAVPRNTQLVSGALPFLTLTMLPVLVAAGWSVYSPWLLALSSLNAAASGADLIAFMLYARRIPSAAMVRNQGYATWWRAPAAQDAQPARQDHGG